ncbi:MAG TPA: hypothetical protein VFQ00_04955 [Terriglobales bacterium]|nr:hypothetical protein [Terriglobales bacterium]
MLKRCLILTACVITIAAPLWSQANQRDPLNDKEVDQLRETAVEPEKRLKLYVQFTRERMDNVEKLRNDPKAPPDRGTKIHDLLEDVASLVDEIDDNVENYDERSADLRKPLKEVIQMDSEFQTKLQQMKAQADDPKNSAQSAEYQFALDDAIDSVNSSAGSSRKLLAEQNVKFEKKKEKKK